MQLPDNRTVEVNHLDDNGVAKVTAAMTTTDTSQSPLVADRWYIVGVIVVASLLVAALIISCLWKLCTIRRKKSSSNKSLSAAIRNGGKSSSSCIGPTTAAAAASGPGSRAVGTGSLLSISSSGSAGGRSVAPLIQGNQRLPDMPIPERRPSARSNSIDPSQIHSECYSDAGSTSPDAETVPRSRSDDGVGGGSPSAGDGSLGTLHFTVAYDAERLALTVTVIKATDLPVRQLDSSNPYVKLQLLPEKRQKAKTRVVRRAVNPVYDESFTFFGIEADQLRSASTTAGQQQQQQQQQHQQQQSSQWNGLTLHMAVLSFDSFARDDLIGEMLYPLNETDLARRAGRPLAISRALRSRTSGKILAGSSLHDRGELLVSLCYQPAADRLTVIVLKARNLPRMDLTGLSDPYVKVYLQYNGQRIAKKKTHVKKRTLNPVFNESFAFDLPASSCASASAGGAPTLHGIRLEFVVYDWDRVTRNEVIGRVEIGDQVKEAEGHWTEVINCPRKQIAEWHRLKP